MTECDGERASCALRTLHPLPIPHHFSLLTSFFHKHYKYIMLNEPVKICYRQSLLMTVSNAAGASHTCGKL